MKGQQARADLSVMSGLGRQGFGAPLFSHCFVTWAAALTVAGSVSGVDLGLWGGETPGVVRRPHRSGQLSQGSRGGQLPPPGLDVRGLHRWGPLRSALDALKLWRGVALGPFMAGGAGWAGRGGSPWISEARWLTEPQHIPSTIGSCDLGPE